MTPDEAIKLASQYGIFNVVLILILFFFAGFILYVMRLQERRENKLFDLLEKTFREESNRTNERHVENQKAMAVLAEADKRQREEHERMIAAQHDCVDGHKKIANILDNVVSKLSLLNGTR